MLGDAGSGRKSFLGWPPCWRAPSVPVRLLHPRNDEPLVGDDGKGGTSQDVNLNDYEGSPKRGPQPACAFGTTFVIGILFEKLPLYQLHSTSLILVLLF